jgi:hypothetical protein
MMNRSQLLMFAMDGALTDVTASSGLERILE